jgi:hypothetical protein
VCVCVDIAEIFKHHPLPISVNGERVSTSYFVLRSWVPVDPVGPMSECCAEAERIIIRQSAMLERAALPPHTKK